ncbi:Myoneurinlike [Caligus rogercresseyi]|uniref:Myoneurinlike n=1 Tax=Caligus rogercresseyi TaxID=217165 RepID=A0A7T8JVA7_CALRO|nr:Myoneurinlike [Caligus rogercresseyi]
MTLISYSKRSLVAARRRPVGTRTSFYPPPLVHLASGRSLSSAQRLKRILMKSGGIQRRSSLYWTRSLMERISYGALRHKRAIRELFHPQRLKLKK